MKKVLIITYYWPPAGGPGVQRWLKFVKYFREFGVEPIVYVPENPNYPLVDDSFVSDIPSDIEIIKFPIKEPYGLAKLFSKKKTKQISSGIISAKKTSIIEKLMLYVRGNFFIPDARIGWVKPSVKFLSDYISKNSIDAIITTGPPHSLHLIGLELKRQINLKWIADFRDPWTTIHYHKSLRLNSNSQRKHKELESLVLNTADRIVVTSFTTKKEFEQIARTPIEVITNGYDFVPEVNKRIDEYFSISHIGSLLSERNPEILWSVLKSISEENISFRNDLKLKFAGAVSDEVKESLQENNLLSNTIFKGYVSHNEAIELQTSSQVLLLVEIDSDETRAIIPGKLFEYLVAKRPIIALGPKGSDIQNIIKETNSGEFFDYSKKNELKTKILAYYHAYKNGDLFVIPHEINQYSRRELTKKMAGVIDKLTS